MSGADNPLIRYADAKAETAPSAEAGMWRSIAAEIRRLERERSSALEALRMVETWWMAEGMKHFIGAPAAIFATREEIRRAKGEPE